MSFPAASTFLDRVRSPFKLRLFLLAKLPAAFLAGLSVKEATENTCMVTVPYRWFTQNPFRSTYFACLAMAAELSTGVLAMAQLQGSRPAVSMLITGMEARFLKKATGTTWFTCADGAKIAKAVASARAADAGEAVTVVSTGRNAAGEVVAEFAFTWSFRAKR
ncbi:MAG: hypothetical protein JWP27_2789 [Flaviaesturariibacter sp.]|nr:hypothetical protein [Flaviaesturariibacter sp.]